MVYRFCNSEMYSFLIKKAIVAIKAELLAIGVPKLGLTADVVEFTIVEFGPNKISENLKLLCFF